jgi:Domain of unknown function (DUF4389)
MTTATVPYPAHLTGELAPRLSRWLWIVKTILAVPHFIVLGGLGVAFVATTLFAGFAILFTGRYPRGLFDFNVGVLRWNWRVGFYVLAVMGTDRYPPFTLAKTDYPADFDVDYPERLSRGLVLVKSWLLALPHLIITMLVVGEVLVYPLSSGSGPAAIAAQQAGAFSVLGLLVLMAGLLVLITGTYPRVLFDFLLGINRWLYRVTTYVALMRDEYPPFRLDTGSRETGPHTASLERQH